MVFEPHGSKSFDIPPKYLHHYSMVTARWLLALAADHASRMFESRNWQLENSKLIETASNCFYIESSIFCLFSFFRSKISHKLI